MTVRVLTITNQRGLHARASAKFVACAGKFNAEITVEKDGQSVNALSIMGLMMLAAGPGSDITLTASGDEAIAALDALESLVGDKFGEGE